MSTALEADRLFVSGETRRRPCATPIRIELRIQRLECHPLSLLPPGAVELRGLVPLVTCLRLATSALENDGGRKRWRWSMDGQARGRGNYLLARGSNELTWIEAGQSTLDSCGRGAPHGLLPSVSMLGVILGAVAAILSTSGGLPGSAREPLERVAGTGRESSQRLNWREWVTQGGHHADATPEAGTCRSGRARHRTEEASRLSSLEEGDSRQRPPDAAAEPAS